MARFTTLTDADWAAVLDDLGVTYTYTGSAFWIPATSVWMATEGSCWQSDAEDLSRTSGHRVIRVASDPYPRPPVSVERVPDPDVPLVSIVNVDGKQVAATHHLPGDIDATTIDAAKERAMAESKARRWLRTGKEVSGWSFEVAE